MHTSTILCGNCGLYYEVLQDALDCFFNHDLEEQCSLRRCVLEAVYKPSPRTRAYLRHQRARVIKRRMRVVMEVWGCYRRLTLERYVLPGSRLYPYEGKEGALGKSNLKDHSCDACNNDSYSRLKFHRETRWLLLEEAC